jgi:hypothetical protein
MQILRIFFNCCGKVKDELLDVVFEKLLDLVPTHLSSPYIFRLGTRIPEDRFDL